MTTRSSSRRTIRRLGLAALALTLLVPAGAATAGGGGDGADRGSATVEATHLGLAGRAAEALGEDFAGASERPSGELVVQAAAGRSDARAALGALAGRVELETVALSADQLGAGARAVLAELQAGGHHHGASVHTSPGRGAVVVGAALDRAEREALAEAASPARLVVRPPSGLRLTEGGRQILIEGIFLCTNGFDVVDAGGRPLGLTAGHCGREGDPVSSPNKRLGTILGSAFFCCRTTSSDSGIFSVPPDYPNGLVHTGRRSLPLTGAFDNDALHRGMRLCYYGRTSRRQRCGEVRRTNFSVVPGGGGGRTVRNLVCIREGVRSGDSGGPAYQREQGGVTAAGVVSLGSSRLACFAKIETALRLWDVTLIPG